MASGTSPSSTKLNLQDELKKSFLMNRKKEIKSDDVNIEVKDLMKYTK